MRLGLHGEHAELQRLIGGGLAGGDPLDLHAIDAVGKLGQGVVHLDPLPGDEHAEIIRPHLGGQIVTGPAQCQFRIAEIDFRRGLGEPQLAAGDDRLTDAAALVAGGLPRIDVVRLIADVRVGIGAGLDHVAAGRFHVGRRLANERIAAHRHRLQLGERQRRLAGRKNRLGHGGMTSKSAKRASIALRCSAGVAPGWAGGKLNGGAALPGIALGISSG